MRRVLVILLLVSLIAGLLPPVSASSPSFPSQFSLSRRITTEAIPPMPMWVQRPLLITASALSLVHALRGPHTDAPALVNNLAFSPLGLSLLSRSAFLRRLFS